MASDMRDRRLSSPTQRNRALTVSRKQQEQQRAMSLYVLSVLQRAISSFYLHPQTVLHAATCLLSLLLLLAQVLHASSFKDCTASHLSFTRFDFLSILLVETAPLKDIQQVREILFWYPRGGNQQLCGKKIRVLCADPDATESSSDETQFVSKRLVWERYVPEDCCLSSSDDEDLENESSCLSSLTTKFLSHEPVNRQLEKPSAKQHAKRKLYHETEFCIKRNRKPCMYRNLRQRRWGRWAAEIRDPGKAFRLRLDTYDTLEGAAKAYEDAAVQLKSPAASTNVSYLTDCKDAVSRLSPGSSSSFSSQGYLDDLNGDSLMSSSKLNCTCMTSNPLENVFLESSQMERSIGLANEIPCSPRVYILMLILSCSHYQEQEQGKNLREFTFFSVLEIAIPAEFVYTLPSPSILRRWRNTDAELNSSPEFTSEKFIATCVQDVSLADGSLPSSFNEDFSSVIVDLGQIFVIKDSQVGFENYAAEFLDPVDVPKDADEFSFDLDPEALAWINIPEVCGF